MTNINKGYYDLEQLKSIARMYKIDPNKVINGATLYNEMFKLNKSTVGKNG